MRSNPYTKVSGRRGILSRLRLRPEALPYPEINGLLSPEEFERELHRQRARSDRTGLHFLLLSFKLDHQGDSKSLEQMMYLLAQVIFQRSRISDIAGWHGSERKQIGLILPGTPRNAAPCVVRAIEDIFLHRVRTSAMPNLPTPDISSEVFIYPGRSAVQNLVAPPKPEAGIRRP